MVAGEDAEPAGVVRQHLGNAELHREVCDAVGQHRRFIGIRAIDLRELLVPQRTAQVVVQISGQRCQACDEVLVVGQLLQPLGADVTEHRHRVRADEFPQLGIDRLEQILGRFVP